ncbi:GntR family transcriptional regulator [Spongiivirga sp. MCCC 1A20706]|uniref:GntR family transcriptional regulator n=1 Tax=Spongiivirga sp. MCCC 1A20706 TaxID=3160963 RepID=UPI0039772DF1
MKDYQILFDNIHEFVKVKTFSKHEQLVNGIIATIESGYAKKGDRLPSINKMVEELGFARKTIVRAYEEMKSRGLVESKSLKGYYIANTNTKLKLKLAIILYAFHPIQEDFYNAFRKELGKKYQIDVFFHHNNQEVFLNILSTIKGKYGMYVIAPIPSKEMPLLLSDIPKERLLVVDRFIELPDEYSYIAQEFEDSTYQQLVDMLPAIKKYRKFILFFQEASDHPEGIKNAFSRFVDDYNIDGSIEKKYNRGSVRNKTAYFLITDSYLWEVLRDCRNAEYVIGKDVGILSHNDNAVKEMIFGGITTISTDFKQMGIEAAAFVKYGARTHRIIPSKTIRRNSL